MGTVRRRPCGIYHLAMASESHKKGVNTDVLSTLLMNVGVKASLGALAFLPALVIFGGKGMRCTMGGMGIGFGAGFAACQADFHLKHPAVVPLPEHMPFTNVRLGDAATGTYQRFF